MVTVKALIGLRRRLLPWFAGLLLLSVLGLGGYLAWNTFYPAKPPVRSSPRPVPTPVVPPAPSVEQPDAPANAPSVAPPSPQPRPQESAQQSAKPIVVEAAGQAAKLDVQTVMALQRDKAERRLYDRVLALSASGGSSPAAGVALPPGSLSVPAASTDESALGTLLGRPAFSSVQATAGGLPPGPLSEGGNPSLPSSANAPSVNVERQSIRLVSVYARGDFLMAELVLPSGRRIDLEANDIFMGYRVVRVDEGGLTLAGWVDRPGTVFLPIGKSLFK